MVKQKRKTAVLLDGIPAYNQRVACSGNAHFCTSDVIVGDVHHCGQPSSSLNIV
jgi:hypothetical protein